MKLQKAAAIAVSLALVFAMLFSLFFLVAEADHDCASDDCAICRMIHITEDLLKKVILSVCAAAIAALKASCTSVWEPCADERPL